MIQNDILTERQRRCIPDVTFELIPIKNLVSNQDYQRPLSEGHIRKALEEFDVFQINPVKVSRRNGINYVFDGQHTIEIVASESGSRDTPVWCMVYTELQYQEEAHIFADQQKHVKALVPYGNPAVVRGDDGKKHVCMAWPMAERILRMTGRSDEADEVIRKAKEMRDSEVSES